MSVLCPAVSQHLAHNWCPLIHVIFILSSLEHGGWGGVTFPCWVWPAHDWGLRACLASLERHFLQSFLSLQQEPRTCRLLADRQPHPSLQASPLISKHSPLHLLWGFLSSGNSVSMGAGGWLISEEFPWFRKQPSAWESRSLHGLI